MITSIDQLRGPAREEALQKALGVDPSQLRDHVGVASTSVSDDILAVRQLAEAVEAVIRGDNQNTLGLDWTKS